MKAFDFTCSKDEFNKLHQSIERTRSTSATVSVDKQALTNLLIDHGKLLSLLKIEEKA